MGKPAIALLVMTDGRADCLEATIRRSYETLNGPITRRIIHDDSGDNLYRGALAIAYPDFEIVSTPARVGFGGAIRSAWRHLLVHVDEPYVFHLEDDFLLNREVNLAALADILHTQPQLAQLALRRQPWSADEHAAGGVVEQDPESYIDTGRGDHSWLEHVRFWTTNPSLYRRELCTVGWPDGQESEGHFGLHLRQVGLPWGVQGDQVRFGYWGARDSGEWVEHVGHERVGNGY